MLMAKSIERRLMISFESIIVIGQGKVAKECARIARDKFDNVKLLDINEISNLDEYFNSLKDHLIISANNTYIFKPRCVENNAIINYHNALLPNHRGVNAHIWAIWCGDKKSGITWHKVDNGIDSGEILIQKEINIENMSAKELLLAQHMLAIASFSELVDVDFAPLCLVANDPKSSQMHKKSELPNGAILNLDWHSDIIARFLRAFDLGIFANIPRPRVMYKGELVEIDCYEIDLNVIKITLKNQENLIIKKD